MSHWRNRMQNTPGPFGPEEPRTPKVLIWVILVGLALTTTFFTYDYVVNCGNLGLIKGCVAVKKPF